ASTNSNTIRDGTPSGLLPAQIAGTVPAGVLVPLPAPGFPNPQSVSLLRPPLARELLSLGDLLWRHLARHHVAVFDGGVAVARIGGGEARGGEVEPHMRADVVLLHALAGGVGEPEIVLRHGVALIGGEAVPLRRLLGVLRHAAAFREHHPEIGARRGIALVGGAAEPLHRLVVVFRHAAAAIIHKPEDGLGLGIARLGERTREAEGRWRV